jgi:hypothetical protein
MPIGDHYFKQLRKEQANAVGQSDVKVEIRQPALGEQEGAGSKEPEAGGGDHVEREEGGKEGEVGVQEQE